MIRAADPRPLALSQAASSYEYCINQRDGNPRQRGIKTSFRSEKHDCRAKQKTAAIAHENARGRIVEAQEPDACAGAGHPDIAAQTQKGGRNCTRGKTIGMIEHVDRIAGYPNDDRNPPQTCDDSSQNRRSGQCRCLGAGGQGSYVVQRADQAETTQQKNMLKRKPWRHCDQHGWACQPGNLARCVPSVALDLRNRSDLDRKTRKQPDARNCHEQGPDERDQWAKRQANTRSVRMCSMQSAIVCFVLRTGRHPVMVVKRLVSGTRS